MECADITEIYNSRIVDVLWGYKDSIRIPSFQEGDIGHPKDIVNPMLMTMPLSTVKFILPFYYVK